jgi:ubiquinone/menaquinone biosynthesis C-methylase UbiE
MFRNKFLASLLRKILPYLPQRNNSVANNLATWLAYDWSNRGEEWSNTPNWKDSLVEHVLQPHVPFGSRVLEIGPGAGRWTEYLIPRASHLILVDLTPTCIEICKERFQEFQHIEYYVNDGQSLDFLADASIDCVWSWDVFVHIASADVREYVRHISRVMAPRGQALIHHARRGRTRAGWRSDMTDAKMGEFCREFSLEVLRQFESWDGGRYSIWPNLGREASPDTITVFQKP